MSLNKYQSLPQRSIGLKVESTQVLLVQHGWQAIATHPYCLKKQFKRNLKLKFIYRFLCD